uniref:palmitoyl-protein hydrolase n=1 Tax=Steinernema glaseri TaxID=37863 RepID=A0A1I7Z9W4_9BILA
MLLVSVCKAGNGFRLCPNDRTRRTEYEYIIFFHGLGDQGDGWASMFRDEIRIKTVKYICPNAADRAVTLNFGMRMPAWFDLKGLSEDAEEDDQGIAAATQYVHNLVDQEIAAGVPANKIILGGFSMGGALAIYAGLTCKHKLAGIVGLSSFLLQRTKLPGSHTANMQTNILLGHGSNDFLVPLSFGERTRDAIKVFNPHVEMKIYPGIQHSSCPQEMTDVKNFIEKVLK